MPEKEIFNLLQPKDTRATEQHKLPSLTETLQLSEKKMSGFIEQTLNVFTQIDQRLSRIEAKIESNTAYSQEKDELLKIERRILQYFEQILLKELDKAKRT